MSSLLNSLVSRPVEERTEILASLTDDQAKQILYDWSFWARENQLPPDTDWSTWMLKAGRGFGKTRTGGEWIRDRYQKGHGYFAFVAVTPADVRDVMIEGESGILKLSPPWDMPLYEPSKRKLTWPNGAYALAFSSYEPDHLRGPQFDSAWCDELGAWKYPQETWDNLQFALRLGDDPRCVVTTTPRPIRLIRDLMADESCAVTSGSTYENRDNLAPAFYRQIVRRYEGTRTGRQEIHAEILEEAEGALWQRQWLDEGRIAKAPALTRVVVAIDPAVTSTEQSDETGIVVAGVSGSGADAHGYVLDDGSGRYSPKGWAQKAVDLFDYHQADRIIGETNNGGEMIEFTLRTVHADRALSYKAVHASRGKAARAEPVAALYEQGRIHHVGMFAELEDQLCTWEPQGRDKSPDRLDALVWALTELMVSSGSSRVRFID